MTDAPSRPTRHKIGSARTIQTAVLVVEYLCKRYGKERFHYVFTDPTVQLTGDQGVYLDFLEALHWRYVEQGWNGNEEEHK